MDGVRAYWDGCRLLSRHGRLLSAPEEFIQALPRGTALDGELWMGRGTFETLISLLNFRNQDWSEVEYCIFDLPCSTAPYKERITQLRQLQLAPQVHDMTCHCLLIPLIHPLKP